MLNTEIPTLIRANWALLTDGWHQSVCFCIDDRGKITSVESFTGADREGTIDIDIAIPGMINAHSHAFQRNLTGRTQRFTEPEDDFWSWRTHMYRNAGQLTPAIQSRVVTSLYSELIQNGYTSVCEFQYAHGTVERSNAEIPALMSGAIADSGLAVGIRTQVLPVLYQNGGFGNRPAGSEQRSFILDTAVYLGLIDHLSETYDTEETISIGYAPHSLRAVGYDSLQAILDHRTQFAPEAPFHIHVSEQVREVNECTLGTGLSPIEWLFKNFNPDEHWCLIHATHASRSEIEQIIDSGIPVCLCPSTEADLGDGLFPFADFISRGGLFSIGSDSNVCVSPTQEIRYLDYQSRLSIRRRNAFHFDGRIGIGTRLYQSALEGGRKASSLPVGRLEVDCYADIVELTSEHFLSESRSADEIMSAYVYGGGKELIKRVFVGGKEVAG